MTASRRGETRVRRALIAAGALVMLYAVGGALFDGDVNKVGVPAFLIAVIVLHDGVFMPVVLGAGALINRLVAPRWRASVQVAALVSVAVSLVALPLVLGYGRDPANPSALPLPYERGLLLILGLIWVFALGRQGFARWRLLILGLIWVFALGRKGFARWRRRRLR